MTDTETGTVSDQGNTDIADAYEAGDSIASNYLLPAKVGLSFAVVIGFGFLLRRVSGNQLGDSLGAIVVWFSLIFAGALAVGWLGFRALGAVQDSGQDV